MSLLAILYFGVMTILAVAYAIIASKPNLMEDHATRLEQRALKFRSYKKTPMWMYARMVVVMVFWPVALLLAACSEGPTND